MQTQHVPVMLEEALAFLQPQAGGMYVDGTVGGGGHSEAILAKSAPNGRVLGIDADADALARVRERLAGALSDGRLLLAQANFDEMGRLVDEYDFAPVEGVLLDLGFSSDQVESAERGFSFNTDGPLDMRLDRRQAETAADIVNTANEQRLADIFWRYGEETHARRIARRIVQRRAQGPITRTKQLAALVAAGVSYKPGAIHPATRVFQALRIAVNAELERLETVLPQILDVLSAGYRGEIGSRRAGGRMVVIAFHSLEDRIVKEFMRREAKDCICPPQTPVCICGHKARLRILTRKPVTPSEAEIAANPRARSAKLRAAEAIIDTEDLCSGLTDGNTRR